MKSTHKTTLPAYLTATHENLSWESVAVHNQQVVQILTNVSFINGLRCAVQF